MGCYFGQKRSRRIGQRGTVLLVALGVLALLAILATSFFTLASVERHVSHSYVDQVRAKMLAASGIEQALLEIRQTSWSPNATYCGEDWNDNNVDDGDDANGNANGVLDTLMMGTSTPPEEATLLMRTMYAWPPSLITWERSSTTSAACKACRLCSAAPSGTRSSETAPSRPAISRSRNSFRGGS